MLHLVSYKLTDVSEVFSTFIIGMMRRTVSISETSVNFYEATRRPTRQPSSVGSLVWFGGAFRWANGRLGY
jgi:hypothetical protein